MLGEQSMSQYSSDKKMQKLFEGFRKTVLSEGRAFSMDDPLSLKDPINKAIHGLITSVNSSSTAEGCHSNAYPVIMLVSQVIGMMAPISDIQSWYLSAAILRYHEKMIDYKEQLKKDFERNKTGFVEHFFDSDEGDDWREIDAKQVEFHREVEGMVGTIEHGGEPDIDFQEVTASDIDNLKGKFVASNLVDVNDGTFLDGWKSTPRESAKQSLYDNAIYRGYEEYFEN